MSARLSGLAVFLGAAALLGFGGPTADAPRLLAALAALLVLAACGLPHHGIGRSGWRLGVAAAAVAGLVLIEPTPVRVACFAVVVLAVGGELAAGAFAAVLLAGAFDALSGFLPGLPELGAELATALGTRFHPDAAPGLQFGPSAASLPLAGLAALLLLARAVRRPSLAPWLALAGVAAYLPFQWQAHAFFAANLGAHAGHGHASEIAVFDWTSTTMLAFAALVLAGWSAGVPRAPRDASRRRLTLAGGAGLALGLGLAILLAGWRGEGAPDRRVAVLNVGGLDWERPNWDELGSYSGGMFGLWPVYLRNAGWSIEALSEEALPEFGRDDAQVLVLVNCHRRWTETERGRLEDFLRDGGSILVLGDHTDVFGLMEGGNTLLEPWGFSFQFDSAYHTGGGWEDDLVWKPGMLGMGWDAHEAGIGIGASVAVSWPARSVVQGRYSFGDEGIRENVMGSYLGDYTYAVGEPLGDLCLVGGRHFGKGKVVVYGDTSGFQNGGLSATFASHMEPLLDRLARPAAFAFPELLALMIASLALLGGAWLVVRPGAAGLTAACAVLVPVVAAAALDPPPDPGDTMARMDVSRSLVVDLSHQSDIGHYEAGWNTIGPLETAAHRSNLNVLRMESWDGDLVRRARALALIAPREALSERQMADVDAALEGGATVFAAATGAHADGLRPFLARHGVAIGAASLGNVPETGRQEELEPRFVDASPLEWHDRAATEALYRYGDLSLAAARPVGAGWLLVFGDTRFFSSHNTEGMWGWWGGNLRFLHDLFSTYADGEPDGVAELLPPPVSPEE